MTTISKMNEPKENKPPVLTGLDLLRAPFLPNQISKLPKPTKAQTDAVKADYKVGIRCKVCNGWHHPDVIHLDYVGHAALTDRLLDCDSGWSWEPVSFDANGSPFLDKNGGLWIKLTVCGITRLGYGHPDGKIGGDAIKEAIGDAMRNAAMRFGAALDLWHKGDLHAKEEIEEAPKVEPIKTIAKQTFTEAELYALVKEVHASQNIDQLNEVRKKLTASKPRMTTEQIKLCGKAVTLKEGLLVQAPADDIPW